MVDVVLLGLGFAALIAGGELIVRSAVSIAQRLHVSPMIIGLTLVGFGTSTPELVTSIEAALIGSPGIAVGNVVGSNIANILLILGVAASIAAIRVTPSDFWRDGSVLAVVSVICAAVVLSGTLDRMVGMILIVCLMAYLVGIVMLERRRRTGGQGVYVAEAAVLTPLAARPVVVGVVFVAGLVLTILGAKLVVGGAVSIAAGLGVSEAVIGLTVVAIGTSMPELVTSALAARKGQSDVAFGNIIGSNIFNVLGILGVTAIVQPLTVPASIAAFDIWVMLAATLLLFCVTVTGWRVSRREGVLLLSAFAAYILYNVVTASQPQL
jgi:cation:H+ antiporter